MPRSLRHPRPSRRDDRVPAPPRPRRRMLAWAGGVVGLAVVALVAAALIPGSHSSADPQGRAVAAVAPASRTAPAASPTTHRVFDSRMSAKAYGELDAAYDEGITPRGQLISADPPVTRSQFDAPVAAYKRYAERWADHLAGATASLTVALRSGDRATAQRRWDTAFAAYLHLGAVYGFLPGTLNDRLAEVPPSTGTTRFPGLHRIERGLWTGQSVRSLVPVSVGVQHATATLRRILPSVSVGPLDFTLRAHEILEDAQRDLMSGMDVPWSGEGVLGTEAALVADRTVIATLTPLLAGRGNILGSAQFWFARLNRALLATRRRDGSYPTIGQLSLTQRELIDGDLAGTLGVTSQIPPALETYAPSIPSIPRPADHERHSR